MQPLPPNNATFVFLRITVKNTVLEPLMNFFYKDFDEMCFLYKGIIITYWGGSY